MNINEAYITLQKASGIEVGDTVKILRKAKNFEMGWNAHWAPVMDNTVGATFQVKEICDLRGIRNPNNSCVYPFFVLKIVKKATKEVTIKLNSEYSAIISEDGITVGCQKFPLSIIDDLAKAKKEILNKK
jgi:hypothetical protein